MQRPRELRRESAQAVAPERLEALSGRIEAWLEADRDQLPLLLPVALGAGIAAWFVLPRPQAWAGWMLGCGGIALAAAALARGGRLGPAIGRAAAELERELDGLVATLVGLVEPLVLLMMGGIVLLMVLAILLPIINLNSLVGL